MTGTDRRTLVLHVGTEKTGTTSIQATLAQNRENLARAGFMFPTTPRPQNHTHLVAACLDDGVCDNIKAHVLAWSKCDEKTFRNRFRNKLEAELVSRPDWHTLLISSELIHSRLTQPSEIERLFAFLRVFVDDVVVILFIRRQDKLALSRFSSALRAGHAGFDDVFDNIGSHYYLRVPQARLIDDFLDYYDYRQLIERFLPHIDEDKLRVALYSEDRVENTQRFFALAGIPASLIDAPVAPLNAAMSVEAQFVLSEINKLCRPWRSDGLRDMTVKSLQREIEQDIKGSVRRATRVDAERFLSRFENSNDWVRERFFPERQTLFDPDFSGYTDQLNYEQLADKCRLDVQRYARRIHEFENNDARSLSFLSNVIARIRQVARRT